MKSKRKKRAKAGRRRAKLVIKLSAWSNYIDYAHQLEGLLGKKPKELEIELVGLGEIPADTALLMRSIIRKRKEGTRVVTNGRSSLRAGAALVWLHGDKRLMRDDARITLRAVGPFEADNAPGVWDDRCRCEYCEMAEQDYIRVLRAINEFLPVKELAGRPIEFATLKQFGLVESEKQDRALAAAFERSPETAGNPRRDD